MLGVPYSCGMKTSLLILLLSIAAISGCSKEDGPQSPPAPAPGGGGSTTVAAKSSATNSGAPITVSMGVQDYDDAVDASGIKQSRATVLVTLPSGSKAGVKYYLTSTTPFGTVKSVVSRNYNSVDYNNAAAGTLTSRTISAGGSAHLYLSGTFTANLGTGYSSVVGTFTDLQAY